VKLNISDGVTGKEVAMRKLWFVSIVTVLFAAETLAEKKEVSFTAADGFALKGTFYSEKAGPGVLS
jgi:hypothetical protein